MFGGHGGQLGMDRAMRRSVGAGWHVSRGVLAGLIAFAFVVQAQAATPDPMAATEAGSPRTLESVIDEIPAGSGGLVMRDTVEAADRLVRAMESRLAVEVHGAIANVTLRQTFDVGTAAGDAILVLDLPAGANADRLHVTVDGAFTASRLAPVAAAARLAQPAPWHVWSVREIARRRPAALVAHVSRLPAPADATDHDAAAQTARDRRVDVQVAFTVPVQFAAGLAELRLPLPAGPQQVSASVDAGVPVAALTLETAAGLRLHAPRPTVEERPGSASPRPIALEARLAGAEAAPGFARLTWRVMPAAEPRLALFSERRDAAGYAIGLIYPPQGGPVDLADLETQVLSRAAPMTILIDGAALDADTDLNALIETLETSTAKLPEGVQLNVVVAGAETAQLAAAPVGAERRDMAAWHRLRARASTTAAPVVDASVLRAVAAATRTAGDGVGAATGQPADVPAETAALRANTTPPAGSTRTGAETPVPHILLVARGRAEGWNDLLAAGIAGALDGARISVLDLEPGAGSALLKRLAELTRGYVETVEPAWMGLDVPAAAARLAAVVRRIAEPSLTQIQLNAAGTSPRIEAFPAPLPDLGGDAPVVFKARIASNKPVTLSVTGRTVRNGSEDGAWRARVELGRGSSVPGIAGAWARAKGAALIARRASGQRPEQIGAALAELSADYRLSGPFTAFVAADVTPHPLPGSVLAVAEAGGFVDDLAPRNWDLAPGMTEVPQPHGTSTAILHAALAARQPGALPAGSSRSAGGVVALTGGWVVPGAFEPTSALANAGDVSSDGQLAADGSSWASPFLLVAVIFAAMCGVTLLLWRSLRPAGSQKRAVAAYLQH